MRRLLLALLFPILLIAQQAAFVHGLEHLPGSGRASTTLDDRHPPGDTYCEKCFTFAQIGAAVDLPLALVVELGALFDPIGFSLPIAPLPHVWNPRSRGPPSLL